jgi:gliding motility-associated-like protein
MQYIVTLTLIFLSLAATGQKQNNNWCFGSKAGLDFNTGTPTAFTSAMNCDEGSASVSHRRTGALLFYTDGVRVYNRTHAIMPNGNGIGNDFLSSSLQGMLIVPFTDDSNKYFVFALEHESAAEGALFYSVVDMRLDGGIGDVVSSQKKIKLGKGFVEGMQAVPTCDGHWLLLSSRTSNEFVAYRINASGIDTQAVFSQMSSPYITSVLGAMKISPDRKKLLYATYTSRQVGGVNYAVATLYDFDERTGKVLNGEHLIDPTPNATHYSVEFSEDGSKAYVSDIRYGIYQFDLALPTPTAIKASKKTVYQNTTGSAASLLQMGPDKNIYVATYGMNSIARISNTNTAVPGCVYTTGAVTLAPGTTSLKSLPPEVTYPEEGSLDTFFSTKDVEICAGADMQLQGQDGAISYTWQDGSNQSTFKVPAEGTYWVTSQFLCSQNTDSFNVKIKSFPLDLGVDTTICKGHPLTVNATIPGDSVEYTWQDGSNADSFIIAWPGTYWVTVDVGTCVIHDTIYIRENDSAYFQLGADTILCTGESYNLYLPAGVDTFRWNTGVKDSMLTVDTPGNYFLEIERGGCSYTDTIVVQYAEESLHIGNDTLVCNGDELTIGGTSILSSTYTWNTGAMRDSIVVSSPDIYTLTIENRCGVLRDTIQVDYKICDCEPFIPNAFTPNNDGRNDMFGPLMKCRIESYEFIVVNRFGEVLFRSTDRQQKWDGTYKGRPCDVGGYFYFLKIKNISGKDDLRKGDVILIR